jgi:hypothetical protein
VVVEEEAELETVEEVVLAAVEAAEVVVVDELALEDEGVPEEFPPLTHPARPMIPQRSATPKAIFFFDINVLLLKMTLLYCNRFHLYFNCDYCKKTKNPDGKKQFLNIEN